MRSNQSIELLGIGFALNTVITVKIDPHDQYWGIGAKKEVLFRFCDIARCYLTLTEEEKRSVKVVEEQNKV